MADEDDVELTEVTKMRINRLDGVEEAANGTPFLVMKSMKKPMGDEGIASDDDETADAEEENDDDIDDEAGKALFCGDDECGVCAGLSAKAKLKAKQRNALPDSDFALSGRRYPIHDPNHARAALSRAAQQMKAGKLSPAEAKRVRAAVRKRYPDIGAEDDSGSSKNMHTGSMGQAEAVHGDRMGPKSMNTQADGARPSEEHYSQPTPPEHDGQGDTAPDKDLQMEEALSQTQENARKSESSGAEGEAERNVDLGGDRAGSGDDAMAEREGRTQTEANRRKGGSGITADEQAAMDYARKNAAEMFQQALVLTGVDLDRVTPKQARKALRQARALLGGLAKTRALPHPSKEISDMTPEELTKLLDERDARARKERKAAKKAAAEKAAAKAAKKALKADGGSEEAAKAAPALDPDAIAASVSEAVKAALSPLASKVENLENQPARPRPALNEHAGQAIARGEGADGEAIKALDALKSRYEAATDPQEKAKLGGELTQARLMIQARQQYGKRIPA